MGLFKRTPKNKVVTWLTMVDEKFCEAVKAKRPILLNDYFSDKALRSVAQSVMSGDIQGGLNVYRQIELKLVEGTDTYEVYDKEVSYKNIKLNSAVSIPCGIAHTERWTVDTSTGKYTVIAVKGVEC